MDELLEGSTFLTCTEFLATGIRFRPTFEWRLPELPTKQNNCKLIEEDQFSERLTLHPVFFRVS